MSALLCNGKKVDALLKDGMVAAFPKEHHISMKISKFSGEPQSYPLMLVNYLKTQNFKLTNDISGHNPENSKAATSARFKIKSTKTATNK